MSKWIEENEDTLVRYISMGKWELRLTVSQAYEEVVWVITQKGDDYYEPNNIISQGSARTWREAGRNGTNAATSLLDGSNKMGETRVAAKLRRQVQFEAQQTRERAADDADRRAAGIRPHDE
jgi:hypothetical protein